MKKKTIIFTLVFLVVLSFSCRKHKLNNNLCDCADSPSQYTIDTVSLYIPNVITPNGDGYNDKWIILNIDKFPDCSIKLTKGGITKYTSTGYEDFWPDKKVSEGKYNYTIEIGDQTIKGSLCVYYKEGLTAQDFDCIENLSPMDFNDIMLLR
jgi:hypothetical protein